MKNGDIDPILQRIHELRNFDFRNYKKATLIRRVERRMQEHGCDTVPKYLRILDREPEEIQKLLSSMLIKVTSFLRDPEIWEHLSKKVLPEMLAAKRDDELRVWCAGCATGQEAFTIAILLAEALGPAFPTYRVKIFGTDVDESAISFARRGVYDDGALENMPRELLARWFLRTPEGWAVRQEIRRVVVFGVNNLVSDAPISRLDLITCRNVFIYLDAELQKRVLARFHYALRREGVLLLGKAELIPFASKIFEPIDLPLRIYRKDGKRSAGSTERLMELLEAENTRREASGDGDDPASVLSEFYRSSLDSLHLPMIVTSNDGTVNLWNRAAARLWNRTEQDVIGKKLATLGVAGLTGELLVEKTELIRASRSAHEVSTGVIEIPSRGTSAHLRAHVYPLRVSDREQGLVYLVEDVTEIHAAEEEVALAKQEARKSQDQMREWSEEQQASTEELETTNEELQSANEELQTTNEELQSTNEELETTNEELQSTNAELDATNRELASRTEQMNLLSSYQRTIIRSISAAVVVLDPSGRITTWNLAAERLLGLPEGEALGQTFWTLRIPALGRPVISRVRRAISEHKAFRSDSFRLTLPGGAKGYANIAAIPLVENETHLGSVILVEDATRAKVLAHELAELKRQVRPPRAVTSAPGKRTNMKTAKR